MILVVETDQGFNASSGFGRLQQLLPAHHDELSFDHRTLRYYDVQSEVNSSEMIAELLKTPGVLSAYFKPEGSPP